MLCQECSNIPLDLFLPKRGSGRWFKGGLAWKEAIVFRKGPDRLSAMRESADAGCGMCSIMLAALDNAEPLWAAKEFTSRGHTMLLNRGQQQRHPREPDEEEGREWITLTVQNEGEMVISDGRRKGGLYWELKSQDWGRGLGRWPKESSAVCLTRRVNSSSARPNTRQRRLQRVYRNGIRMVEYLYIPAQILCQGARGYIPTKPTDRNKRWGRSASLAAGIHWRLVYGHARVGLLCTELLLGHRQG